MIQVLKKKNISQHALVKRFFDGDSKRYSNERYTKDFRDCHQYSYLVRKEHVLDLLEASDGWLLDAGCGPGVYTDDLLDMGFKVWGVDISNGMIDKAREIFAREISQGRVKFEVGSIESVILPSDYFDTAICIGLVSYIPNIEVFLSKLSNIVKPGGLVVFQISKKYSLNAFNERIILKVTSIIKKMLGRSNAREYWDFQLYRYRAARFNAICARFGFKLEKGIHFNYTLPVLSLLAKRVNLSLAKFLERKGARIIQLILAGDYIGRYRLIR